MHEILTGCLGGSGLGELASPCILGSFWWVNGWWILKFWRGKLCRRSFIKSPRGTGHSGVWGAHSVGRDVVLQFWRVWEHKDKMRYKLIPQWPACKLRRKQQQMKTWRGRKQANRLPAAYNFPLSLKAQMPWGLLAFSTSCPRGLGARCGVADGEGARLSCFPAGPLL